VNGYLVDTNILSELTKPTPAPQVEAFLDLVLVTRNVRDYEDLGITILNPWEAA
jgi:predicted nucleic acid-binding protein